MACAVALVSVGLVTGDALAVGTAPVVPTDTTLTSSLAGATYGQSITFTATVVNAGVARPLGNLQQNPAISGDVVFDVGARPRRWRSAAPGWRR